MSLGIARCFHPGSNKKIAIALAGAAACGHNNGLPLLQLLRTHSFTCRKELLFSEKRVTFSVASRFGRSELHTTRRLGSSGSLRILRSFGTPVRSAQQQQQQQQQRTAWDDAADDFFSQVGTKGTPDYALAAAQTTDDVYPVVARKIRHLKTSGGEASESDTWERSERTSFERRGGNVRNANRQNEAVAARGDFDGNLRGRKLNGLSKGEERWGASANYLGGDSDGQGQGWDRSARGRSKSPRASDSSRDRRDLDRKLGHAGERIGANHRQKPGSWVSRSRNDEETQNNSSHAWERDQWRPARRKTSERGDGSEYFERDPSPDGTGSDDWRGIARGGRSSSSATALRVNGQALYGVAPIMSSLLISRRKMYCLYMQENLLQNIEKGKRKDKAAVSFIERTARSMGVEVKEASKHSLNILVDNRPHQGMVLDASPLELVSVDMLDSPLSNDSDKPPVWVALDEVTDPQNFGAVLRSAHFLGAQGVVVCSKNSAPLSGVVSKASAGAMEVMEVHSCSNMMKFLERCKENGWRIVGASAQPGSVPIQELSHGVATILVLGNEGTGLRTNVRRSCDLLVSIGGGGVSTGYPQSAADDQVVALNLEEAGLHASLKGDGDGARHGAELALMSGPLAVDSLNVSVAAGIMLYELLSSSRLVNNDGAIH